MATEANKAELADVLGVSLPTLDRLIKRYDDFPVAERGSNGRAYVFLVEDVKTFLDGKRAEEEEAAARHLDLLQDLQGSPTDDDAPARMSPAQELALAKAERERRKLRLEAGYLIDTATFRQALLPVFMELGQFIQGQPARIGRRFNLPAEVIDAMTAENADELRRFVDKMKRAHGLPAETGSGVREGLDVGFAATG